MREVFKKRDTRVTMPFFIKKILKPCFKVDKSNFMI